MTFPILRMEGGEGSTDYDRIVMDSSSDKVYLIEKPIEYETVDLGLPSGTIWMTEPLHNKNGEYLYFQWGDTKGYTKAQIDAKVKLFTKEDYKWYDKETSSYIKYGTDNEIIENEDDPIYVHTNGKFRMPTVDEVAELINNSYTAKDYKTSWSVDGVLQTKYVLTSKIITGHTLNFNGGVIKNDYLLNEYRSDEGVLVTNTTYYTNYISSALYYSTYTPPQMQSTIARYFKYNGFLMMGVLNK